MTGLVGKLDVVERAEWRRQKAIIDKGRQEFWAFIEAIRVVRDQRLYREEYKTFEDFAEEYCGLGKSYMNRILSASEVRSDLAPIVTKIHQAGGIQSEGQLRELVDVPRDSLEPVVQKAAEIAGDGKITAKVLRQAKEEVFAEAPADDEEEEPTTEEPATESEYERASKAVANSQVHRTILQHLNESLRIVKGVDGSQGGLEMLGSKADGVVDKIDEAKRRVSSTMPAAVCDRCNGTRCPQCENLGWVTSYRKKELGG